MLASFDEHLARYLEHKAAVERRICPRCSMRPARRGCCEPCRRVKNRGWCRAYYLRRRQPVVEAQYREWRHMEYIRLELQGPPGNLKSTLDRARVVDCTKYLGPMRMPS